MNNNFKNFEAAVTFAERVTGKPLDRHQRTRLAVITDENPDKTPEELAFLFAKSGGTSAFGRAARELGTGAKELINGLANKVAEKTK